MNITNTPQSTKAKQPVPALAQLKSAVSILTGVGMPRPAKTLAHCKNIIQGVETLGHKGSRSIGYLKKGSPERGRVIFIHGTPGTALDWVDVIDMAPPGLEFIALTRLGYNTGQETEATTSFSEQVGAWERWFEPVNGNHPIIVGHSMGATLALKAACIRPQDFAAVVPVSGAFNAELERIFAVQRLADKFLFRLIPAHWRISNRELLAFPDELRIMESELARVSIPAVFIHGDQDTLVPYPNMAFAAERLTSCTSLETLTLEGMDHFVIWRTPDIILNTITQLAERVFS